MAPECPPPKTRPRTHAWGWPHSILAIRKEHWKHSPDFAHNHASLHGLGPGQHAMPCICQPSPMPFSFALSATPVCFGKALHRRWTFWAGLVSTASNLRSMPKNCAFWTRPSRHLTDESCSRYVESKPLFWSQINRPCTTFVLSRATAGSACYWYHEHKPGTRYFDVGYICVLDARSRPKLSASTHRRNIASRERALAREGGDI